MKLHEIKEALQDRRLNVVAQATGIHENTIRTIRDNPNANPTYKVVESLVKYLKGDEK